MILRGNLFSTTLDMDSGITVITPEEPQENPPQLALVLHGLNSGSDSWANSSMLPTYAKNYNVLFVMPEVGRSYYTDMHYGQRFFSYVARELPQLCRKTFNTATGPENTTVIGASMGGYGALKCALSHPEQFGACCAFSSGSLYTKEFLDRVKKIGDWDKIAGLMGPQRIADFHAIYGDDLEVKPEDELALVAQKASKKPAPPRFYCACGTDDGFLHYNRRFNDELKSLGFDVTYEEWKGGHDWTFFDEALKKALCFRYGPMIPKQFGFVLPEE